jgi:inorganic phosphate transporter, PiT family
MHWPQLWKVLEALALSPLLGFVLAGALYFLTRKAVHDPHLYEPVGDKPPAWWMRTILILTCTGVSFAHGTNDGQKSIGLIMLTIIGIFPAAYALNPAAGQSLNDLPALVQQAQPLVQQYGDDQKTAALAAIWSIQTRVTQGHANARLEGSDTDKAGAPAGLEIGIKSEIAKQRSSVRGDVYQVIAELKHVEEASGVSAPDKSEAKQIAKRLGKSVEYAPGWVRALSALCLGIGTMIGYKRIVKTLGERLGNVHLTPAQGASAEVVASVLIGIAGFTGLPVSTTHIVTSGIGGTMVASGAGLQYRMLSRIAIAWVFTLPVTILIAAGLYFLLTSPRL